MWHYFCNSIKIGQKLTFFWFVFLNGKYIYRAMLWKKKEFLLKTSLMKHFVQAIALCYLKKNCRHLDQNENHVKLHWYLYRGSNELHMLMFILGGHTRPIYYIVLWSKELTALLLKLWMLWCLTKYNSYYQTRGGQCDCPSVKI